MITLILEEAGTARTFRMGDGILTVGSGEAARLRVSDASVAEIHFELELTGSSAEIRVRPGVLPPRIEGAADSEVTGARPLEPGQVLVIGKVRIWIEAEALEGGARSSPAAPKKKPIRKHPSYGGRRSKVKRRRPRVERGLPSWAITSLILGGVSLALFAGFRAFRSQAGKSSAPVWASIQRAEQDLRAGHTDDARDALERISGKSSKSEREEERIAELYVAIERSEHRQEVDVENLSGMKYLEVNLRRYEDRWLSGSPQPHKIRLFLKRCAEFRRRWPEHPELSWVDRLETRFAGSVDLAAEPTWEDLDWEIKYLVAQHWRNYQLAFDLIYAFLGHAQGTDFAAAQELEARLRRERREYFDDRLLQARYELEENKDTSKSIGWLLHLVIWTGDEAMANEAAGYLVKIPGAEKHIEAYEDAFPERYVAVLEHPEVRAFAQSKGLLP